MARVKLSHLRRHQLRRECNGFVELGCIFTAGLSEVGASTATAAGDFGQFAHDVTGMRALFDGALAGLHSPQNFAVAFGGKHDDAITALEASRRWRIPAYGLFSVTLRTRPIFEHFEASLGVVNVTDLAYQDDVPRPDESEVTGLLPGEGIHAMLNVRASY